MTCPSEPFFENKTCSSQIGSFLAAFRIQISAIFAKELQWFFS